MSSTHQAAHRGVGRRVHLSVVLVALVVAACGVVTTTAPAPTPADFQGTASEFAKRGLVIDKAVSGDAGCTDPVLTPTAIGFDASGLDQPTVIRIRLYVFADRATFERLRPSVDACARSFVTDPATYETIEQSPFVLVGQGPWGTTFAAALRAGLQMAAGTGG
jgi:hypothetical protein